MLVLIWSDLLIKTQSVCVKLKSSVSKAHFLLLIGFTFSIPEIHSELLLWMFSRTTVCFESVRVLVFTRFSSSAATWSRKEKSRSCGIFLSFPILQAAANPKSAQQFSVLSISFQSHGLCLVSLCLSNAALTTANFNKPLKREESLFNKSGKTLSITAVKRETDVNVDSSQTCESFRMIKD